MLDYIVMVFCVMYTICKELQYFVYNSTNIVFVDGQDDTLCLCK